MSVPEKIADKRKVFLKALLGEALGSIRTAVNIFSFSKMIEDSVFPKSISIKSYLTGT